MDFSNKTYLELKEIATNENLTFAGNISTKSLIKLLQKHFEEKEDVPNEKKEYTLVEILQHTDKLKAEIARRESRNKDIIKENKYLDERILEVKQTSSTLDEGQINTIEKFNKMKSENSRQYQENVKFITDNNFELISLEKDKLTLASKAIEEKEKIHKELLKKIDSIPYEMLESIYNLCAKFDKTQKDIIDSRMELQAICNECGTKFVEPKLATSKLNIAESHQILNRLRDLSKIKERVDSRNV